MAMLIVCEKPKVAEKVATALAEEGLERKRKFNVNYFELKRGGKKILVAPAVGHLYTLKQESKGYTYPVFDIDWVASWKVEKGAKFTKEYVQLLESLGKECDEFVNSCDFDVEGSLIGANVIRYACKFKLEKAKRMKFSALTTEDLVEAYEQMGPLDINNATAGEARHILDWFWGINMSRALMAAIKSAGTYKVMSIGRVQGPALDMLAKKEKDISAFKPEPYWQLFAHASKVPFLHVKERFFAKAEAEASRSNSEANKDNAIIEKVSRAEKKLPPNPPFDLTSLQVEAFKCFGFSPAATLSHAQTLYEASLISYPRTSSQKLPAKLNLPKILAKLSQNHAYAEKARALVLAGKFTPFEGKKEDPAHPAIHPTGLAPGDVGEREMKLYDLIVKRFLACFADWAVREGMRVDLGLGPEKYYAGGARTISPGWIEYYAPYGRFEEELLPDFKEGAKVKVSKIEMPEKMTTPPKRFTEASIIQAMDKKNLGTKATRAVVIETLRKRGYISGKKNIEVTQFGLVVDDTLQKHCADILDEQLTREFEDLTDAIADGKANEDDVIREGEGALTAILAKFKKEEGEIGRELVGTLKEQRREESTLGKCPLCGVGELRILRNRATGKQFVGCSSYPNCKRTYPLPQFAFIIKTEKVCEPCKSPIIIVRRKARRDFEMCLDPNCVTKANWGKPKASRTVVIDSKTGKPMEMPAAPAAAAPAQTQTTPATAPAAAPETAAPALTEKPKPKRITKKKVKAEKKAGEASG